MSWENGRSLSRAVSSDTVVDFTYDLSGIRSTKTIDGVQHSYLYAGEKLLRESYGSNVLDFFYDANGTPYALKYNGSIFYYITNLQGDVVQIVDTNGNTVANYEYDPYGKVISTTGTMAEVNPVRYRSYYYDNETELYYLQSRYYDPAVGRFINADSLVSTDLAVLAQNMYAYCENNPVNGEDQNGKFVLSAILAKTAVVVGKAALGASVNVLTTFVAAKVTGQSYSWQDAGVAALSGALGTGNTPLKIAAGVVSGAYSAYMAYKNGASIGGAIMTGAVSAYGTTASVANIAGWTGIDLSIITSTFTDVVFGTASNSIAAATYRVSVDSPKNRASTSGINTVVSATTVRKPIANKSRTTYQNRKRLFTEYYLAA